MAQQSAAVATPAKSVSVPAEADVGKPDPQQLATLSDFLRQYHPASQRNYDLLENRYRVDVNQRIPELDKKFARAFVAIDQLNENRKLFALVCDRNGFQRKRLVPHLKSMSHPAVMTLAAAGAVNISQPDEERFVLVYERPAGKKMSDLLKGQRPNVTQYFLIKNVIAPIASALQRFSELGITHGHIHPDNIFFTDTPVLGDCVSEPCGYSQQFYFEPLERMQAMPTGKGEGGVAQDYYALAVLILHLIHGEKHFADYTPQSLSRAIFKEGAYNALTRGREFPEVFYDFFRGLLTTYSIDRWDDHFLSPWIDGRRYNVLPPPPPIEAVRPFDMGSIKITTRRQLAGVLYENWSQIPALLKAGELLSWVTISLRNRELTESFNRISRVVSEVGNKNEIQLNEQLMRLLMILDPEGPIRIGGLSFHIDGLDSLYADFYLRKAEKELQLLTKYIEFGMANFWLELQRRDSDYVVPPPITAMFTRLDKLRACIRNTSMGFGQERILYDLYPEMPCLSPLCNGRHVTTLAALLSCLDQVAPSHKDQDPIDRHIAAFIASKLSIQHEIKIYEMEALPALIPNTGIFALKLLAAAQHKAGGLHLPGLTHWVSLRILPALENIRSRTLRHHVKEALMHQAKSGYTQLLANLIVSSSYPTADQEGFSKAWRLYNANEAKIVYYRKREFLDQESSKLGLVISRALAYAGFLIILWNVFRQVQ